MRQLPGGYLSLVFLQSDGRSAVGYRGIRRLLFSPILAFAFLFTGSVMAAQTVNQITQTVDVGHVRVLANHRPLWASSVNDIGGVPANQSLEQMTLVLARSPQQEQAFAEFLANQQNPASPDYHQWLTPDEIGARFGLSDSDIDELTSWLQSEGLHINWISPSRIFIGFGGSAGDMNRAFQTELHYYKVNDEQRMSVSSDPTIPAALASAIKAVRGLYTPEERSFLHKQAVQTDSPYLTDSLGDHYLAPADFATIYDLPADVTGAGQAIGIVSWSRTNFNDFNNFKRLTGQNFTNPTEIIPTAYGGVDPGPASTSTSTPAPEGQDEATLDVTRAGSIAPGAKLLLVASVKDEGGIAADTQYLVQSSPVPAQVITISFGFCESASGASGVTFWDTLFQQAAAEGISVFVSSGDSGASGCDASGTPPASPVANSPNYICSSSYATCVGGTEFNDATNASTYWNPTDGNYYSSARSYIPEGGWNEPQNSQSQPMVAGSGGGVSKFISTPSWQTGTGVPSARAGRYTPDIAFSSSGHDGYLVCYAADSGSCVSIFGGTSAAAPSMAGIAALLDQKTGGPQGNLNPQLYQLAASAPSAFHDVTVASSGVTNCSLNIPSMCNNSVPGRSGLTGGQAGYPVTAGYDEVTGLGSLDAANFLNAWTSTATAMPVFSPAAGTYTAVQTVTISDATAGASIYYTIDGTTPTTSSTQYTAPITVSSTETIKAIATSSNSLTSSVATATYTFNPAATPTFSPVAGTYATAQSVIVSDVTAGATIYYTTNGTTPTTSSSQYAGPITVSTSETIKAIAAVGGSMTSAVASATYIIHPAEAPTFSPAAGTYTSIQTVTISDATPGAAIYYTTNGSTPTTSSTQYTGAITVLASETIKAIAAAAGYDTSAVASATYTIILPAAPPTFSPASGIFTTAQLVTISDAAAGATIRYTTDGTTPTSSSLLYTGPILVSSTETIVAIATAAGFSTSAIGAAAYTISTGEWAWMAGNGVGNQPGVYGSLGVGAAGNVPGSRENAASWTDNNGNLWLFGGAGYVSATDNGDLNDFWEFDLSKKQWIWMGGSNTSNQAGVYGVLGSAAAANVPGARDAAVTWTDKNGNLWLFGGYGVDSTGAGGYLNDLWQFNVSTNQWTWMSGSKTVDHPGGYGTLGSAAAGNTPGSRIASTGGVDKNGNLWLFAGYGYDAGSPSQSLNDVWEFNVSTNQWAWMGGSSTVPHKNNGTGGISGVYGAEGYPDSENIPGSRDRAVGWTDKDGNFWLFGGNGYDSTGKSGYLNDVWKFDPSTDQWAWMGGSNTVPGLYEGQPGVYGTLGAAAVGNIPGGRYLATGWADNNNNFWLFGGEGANASGSFSDLNDVWKFNPATNQWTWMDGSGNGDEYGVYGTSGVADPANMPGSRNSAVGWADKNGDLWLFGGSGYGTTANATPFLNDLWKFVPVTPTTQVATPTFNVAAGTYTTAQTVTINDATTGAHIYYTIDGTTPNTSSTVYNNDSIAVSSTETVKAIATASGYTTSAVATAAYTITPPAATPTFSLAAGMYSNAQTVAISDSTTGAVIHYTIDGSTPTASSAVYSGPISVSSTETIKAIATASGYTMSAVATASYTITPSVATPTFSVAAGTYSSAQTVAISDATAGAAIYYTIDGTTPTTGSTVYSSPITASSTETIEAIATANGYSDSAVAIATYTISIPTNPSPVIGSISPAYTSAGGAAFTLTVNGSGFTTGSKVYWGTSALATQYVSSTQVAAQVTASDIAIVGATAITVQTPSPGGGTSNSLQFQVDSAASGTAAPAFTSSTATIAAGSTASYPVTLPSTAASVSAACLNLPSGASCSYSASTNQVTITTSSTTPKGTYQVTVVFSETMPGAASAGILLPILLLPLVFLRKKFTRRGAWFTACLALSLVAGTVFAIGCGGGGGAGSTQTPPSQTHQVTSSGTVGLTVQ